MDNIFSIEAKIRLVDILVEKAVQDLSKLCLKEDEKKSICHDLDKILFELEENLNDLRKMVVA